MIGRAACDATRDATRPGNGRAPRAGELGWRRSAGTLHAGHVELLRTARSFGGRLVAGVLPDDVVAAYKRRPIMTLEERISVVGACRYVGEVVAPAPDVVTLAFLAEHGISMVVHGDDVTVEAIAAVYAEVAAAGMLRLVPRRSALSTTELIRRVRDRGSQA